VLNKIHELRLTSRTLLTLALVGFALLSGMAPNASAREYADALNADIVSPFRKVAEKVVPAVVSIEVTRSMEASMKDHPFFEQFRNFMPDGEMPDNHAPIPGSGSGFLIDAAGLIVTNNHVVRDTETINVTLPGEHDSYAAEVLGLDPKTDLAVIRIIDADGRRFPFVEQGDSETARVGDWAIAVGNPLGELEGSLTVGVISAKGRSQLAIQGGTPAYQDFIQTDAAINFGNSGGPLVDIHGRVIGINTAINAAGQGIGFAIPMQLAAKILPQLIEKGKVTRAYLGVGPMELDSEYAEALGLEIERGILVREVVAGAPADRAGIREGDVITEFAGREVVNIDAFRFLVAERTVGEKVDIRLHRDGDSLLKKVKLVEYPEDEPALAGRSGQNDDFFGMQVEDLASSDFAESMEIDADHGVVVTRIRAGSPAESAELRVGDVIQKVKNMKIRTLEDFEKAKEQFAGSDKRVGLLVQRKAYATFLFITPR
jgi:serine protease Do